MRFMNVANGKVSTMPKNWKEAGDHRVSPSKETQSTESSKFFRSLYDPSKGKELVTEVSNIQDKTVEERNDLKEQNDTIKQAVVQQENSIVARITGHDPETIGKLRDWDWSFNVEIDYIEFKELEQNPRQLDANITRLNDEMAKCIETSRSSSPWATRIIREVARDIVHENPGPIFPDGSYTLHHKISQSKLEILHKEFEQAREGPSSDTKHLQKVVDMLQSITDTGSSRKAFLNMPANIEVGPPTDQRLNDPGTGFDPNVTKDGRMSPRSRELSHVDKMISQRDFNFNSIAQHLEEAQKIHDKIMRRLQKTLLSDPLVEQWKREGNKFRRETE
jgi:hypothetical protein